MRDRAVLSQLGQHGMNENGKQREESSKDWKKLKGRDIECAARVVNLQVMDGDLLESELISM